MNEVGLLVVGTIDVGTIDVGVIDVGVIDEREGVMMSCCQRESRRI